MFITHLFLQVLTPFYLKNLSCHSAFWHQVFQCYHGLLICILELNLTLTCPEVAPVFPKTGTVLPHADISYPLSRQQAVNFALSLHRYGWMLNSSMLPSSTRAPSLRMSFLRTWFAWLIRERNSLCNKLANSRTKLGYLW